MVYADVCVPCLLDVARFKAFLVPDPGTLERLDLRLRGGHLAVIPASRCG